MRRRWLVLGVGVSLVLAAGLTACSGASSDAPKATYVSVKEHLVVPNRNSSPQTKKLAELLAGAKRQDGPIVVDYASLPAAVRQLPLEQRALSDVRSRVERGQSVNILPGILVALGAQSYADREAGKYTSNQTGFYPYEGPLVYFERAHGRTTAVLVTTGSNIQLFAEDFFRKYHGAPEKYFEMPEGTAYYAQTGLKAAPSQEGALYQAWTAARLDDACTGQLASSCLYKAAQKDLAFEGQDQVLLVAPMRREMVAQDPSFVQVVDLGRPGQLRVGGGYGEYYHPQEGPLANQQLTQVLKAGGKAFSGSDLAALPTYSVG